MMVPLSVLDLSPIAEGSDAGQALRNSLDLAQHAERWNYKRFSVIAPATRTIRVGSSGVKLQNMRCWSSQSN